MTLELKQPVIVTIGNTALTGRISGFPAKRVEYLTRPVIVKIGDAEYVTVDMSKVEAL